MLDAFVALLNSPLLMVSLLIAKKLSSSGISSEIAIAIAFLWMAEYFLGTKIFIIHMNFSYPIFRIFTYFEVI